MDRVAGCGLPSVVSMIEWEPGRPRWRQVYEVIVRRIQDGTYGKGERVPSVVQLQEEFGIATATAQKVHRQLREDGLIRTEPGLGSYVL